MKVFYKCACCNRPQNKLQVFTLGGGWKPAMWKCFDTWLKKFQEDLNEKNKHRPDEKKERLQMSLDSFEGEDKKVPYEIQEKYIPPEKRGKKESENIETEHSTAEAWKDWANIDPYFKKQEDETEEMAKSRVLEWTSREFKYSECKEWLAVGFKGDDADFVAWCRDKKNLTSETVLDYYNYQTLKETYAEEIKPDIDEHEAD